MKLVSSLYKLARLARDVEVVMSGDPKKIARRFLNKRILKKVGKTVNLK